MPERPPAHDRMDRSPQTRVGRVVNPAVNGNVDMVLVMIDGLGQQIAEYLGSIPLQFNQRVRVRPQPEGGTWRILNVASPLTSESNLTIWMVTRSGLVRQFNLVGEVLRSWTASSGSDFSGITVAPDGNIWLAGLVATTQTLFECSPDGTELTTVSYSISATPSQISIESNGNFMRVHSHSGTEVFRIDLSDGSTDSSIFVDTSGVGSAASGISIESDGLHAWTILEVGFTAEQRPQRIDASDGSKVAEFFEMGDGYYDPSYSAIAWDPGGDHVFVGYRNFDVTSTTYTIDRRQISDGAVVSTFNSTVSGLPSFADIAVSFESQVQTSPTTPITAENLVYSPLTPADWNGPPTTVQEALDELAARVRTLEGS